MKYDDERFGTIESVWFGLSKKCGGETAAGFTFGTTDATKNIHVTRWYPKGPIRLQKFGAMVLCTTSGGATVMDYVPARLLVNDSQENATDLQIRNAATQYDFASVTEFTNRVVDAGSYMTIKTATAVSDDGTDSKSAIVAGTVAFFIDYVRQPGTTKWDKK